MVRHQANKGAHMEEPAPEPARDNDIGDGNNAFDNLFMVMMPLAAALLAVGACCIAAVVLGKLAF